jgi:type I restriction enzyme S subunit
MSDLEVEELMLKPYPAYKDSGVEWLGQVPEHWEVRRIKTLFREKDERSGDGSGELLSLTRAQGIVRQSEASSRIASAEDLSKYKLCHPHDLVMNRMQAWSGMFAVSSLDGVVSPDYSIFVPTHSLEEKYFEQLFKTPLLVHQFAQRSKGIGSGFNRLYTPDFGAVPVVAPPLPEQAAIVRYLGYMDRRIRRFIRAKQKLIKLLEEQKQVIIHEAVTGQIDVHTGKPYPAYKDSGVEWLGQVPEHWQTSKIKRLAKAGHNTFVDGDWIESPFITSEGIRLIQTGNIGVGVYREQGFRYISEDTFNAFGCTEFQPNDVLICRLGDPVGRACLAPDIGVRMITSVDVCILKPRESVLSTYVVRAMTSSRYLHWVKALVRGSTRDRVSRSMLGSFALPLPPLSEQAAIVHYLDDATANTDSAIAHAKREIDLLREYRTRLIADVVTGKLDVREAAASLPDEAEEPELLAEEGLLTDENEADETVEDEADLEEDEA